MLTGSIPARDIARKLRRTMSLPEVLLWQRLRLRSGSLKFRRQHPAGDYVLDFFCSSASLAIEVNGANHDQLSRHGFDRRRDEWLASQGISVLRIPARDVLADVAAVVDRIISACEPVRLPLHHASHGPPPRAGEDFSKDARWTI